MNDFVRPGIDDRPDYDKALTDEQKESVARLSCIRKTPKPSLPPKASAMQAASPRA